MRQTEKAQASNVLARFFAASASGWFMLSAVLLLLFLVYTFLLTTGALDASTVQIERWLLQRPITRVDCSLHEWRNLGSPSFILLLMSLLGVTCLLLGYRWSVLLWLALLLFVCAVCEVVGKSVLTQPVPHGVNFGMAALNCPQIYDQPASVRLSVAAGLWWKVPPTSESLIEQIHTLAQSPFDFGEEVLLSSYPGGHAMRCAFLGVLICWLCWRHIKHALIRVPMMALVLVVSLSIGFIQFYIGSHLITDTIAGYLFGFAAACCAIGLLLLNGPRRQGKAAAPQTPLSG